MTLPALSLSVLLGAVAVIHLLPLAGVLGAQRLQALYGLPVDDPSLLVLMRHRAVLFGLLGLLLGAAAWHRPLVPLALVAGWTSVLSFLGLAWLHPGHNTAIARVVVADLVALGCLAGATVLWFAGAGRAR